MLASLHSTANMKAHSGTSFLCVRKLSKRAPVIAVGGMAKFTSLGELKAFLVSLDEDFGVYANALWEAGFVSRDKISNASDAILERYVREADIGDLKAKAAGKGTTHFCVDTAESGGFLFVVAAFARVHLVFGMFSTCSAQAAAPVVLI